MKKTFKVKLLSSGATGNVLAVTVPKELKAALAKDKTAAALFNCLANSHQREYVQWVGEAKQAETRLRRAAQALTLLKAGRKTRS
jgi:uncharacterized protein YdeI (YjbR/CyaY-like superfamily)